MTGSLRLIRRFTSLETTSGLLGAVALLWSSGSM